MQEHAKRKTVTSLDVVYALQVFPHFFRLATLTLFAGNDKVALSMASADRVLLVRLRLCFHGSR